jgi:hypothetical protein
MDAVVANWKLDQMETPGRIHSTRDAQLAIDFDS